MRSDVSSDSIRSERSPAEPPQRKLPLRWLSGLPVDDPMRRHSTLGESRDRRLGADGAREPLESAVPPARIHDVRASAARPPRRPTPPRAIARR